MEIYLVGGAVRDLIMNKTPKDQDFVVVGSTEQEMMEHGFTKVGADFPVFLNPITKNEFALARTERKTGKGYLGFEVETDNVTLIDDLRRRDLTINAMAIEQLQIEDFKAGNEKAFLFDPFNGEDDIRSKILRHVDIEGFKEDPVRVLRIARFLARYPDFTVAKDTVKLCKEMVANGELEHLTPERVGMEMLKALDEEVPSRFFYFLRMVGALEIVFPEIHALVGVEQPYEHHPEGDAFIHTMMVIDVVGGHDGLASFCALVHDLGKGITPKEKWPHHYGHEEAGVPIVHAMADRLKLSNEYRYHGALVAKYHMHIHKFHELKTSTILKMFETLKHKSNTRIIELLPEISYCDSIGRTSFHQFKSYPNGMMSMGVFRALANVKLSDLKTPEEIKEMSVDAIIKFMDKAKRDVIRETIDSWNRPAWK